jgi:hypothetical protein
VLLALDERGAELDREELPVAGVVHDGTDGRDAWYIFTAAQFPADPLRPADLEVRQFDGRSWTTLRKVSGLPPPRHDTFVVLNGRLAYLSYQVEANEPVESITILDTTDLSNVREEETSSPGPDGAMLGLVGVRGSDVDDDALGGALTLMIATNCGGDAGVGELGIDTECDLIGQPLFIGDTVSSGVAEGLGTFVGVPTFLSAVTDDSVFALRREPGATGRVLVVEVDPRDPSENSAATTPARAPLLGGAA